MSVYDSTAHTTSLLNFRAQIEINLFEIEFVVATLDSNDVINVHS
jgi:hypothetical protein